MFLFEIIFLCSVHTDNKYMKYKVHFCRALAGKPLLPRWTGDPCLSVGFDDYNMLGIPSAEAIERSSVPFQFSQLHCYFFGWNACTQCDMLGTVKLEGTWAAWGRRSLFLSHISLYMLILLLFVYKKKCCLLNPRTYVFSDLTKLKTIPIYDFNF